MRLQAICDCETLTILEAQISRGVDRLIFGKSRSCREFRTAQSDRQCAPPEGGITSNHLCHWARLKDLRLRGATMTWLVKRVSRDAPRAQRLRFDAAARWVLDEVDNDGLVRGVRSTTGCLPL